MDLRLLQRDVLYRGKIFDLIVDHIEYPSGNAGVREIARHPGGAVAVPLLDDGRVIMVRQFRYPVGRTVLELPAGKLGPGHPHDQVEVGEQTVTGPEHRRPQGISPR